jgi:hypothetical protein
MRLSAQVADSEQWKGEGDDTAADRIAKETGKSKKQARDDLATARRAKKDEKLRKALQQGDVSPEQAKAIGAAGEADPSATEDLLDLAEQGASLGELNEEAERRRREAEGEQHKAKARARAHAGRFARSWTKDEMFFLLLGVTLEQGAEVLAHLGVEREHVFARDRRNGTHATYENRSADAMVNLITGRTANPAASPDEAAPAPEATVPSAPRPKADGEPVDDPDQQDLFGDGAPGVDQPTSDGADDPDLRAPLPAPPQPTPPGPSGGSPAGDAAPAPPPPTPRPRSGPPLKSTPSGRMVARLDLPHLWASPGEATCDLAGIGTVSLDAMQAVLPDPWVQLVITRGKDVVHATNIGRGADLWQQAALIWTLGGRCSNLGCNRTAQIQNDHRKPWTEDRVTLLPNLDPLCTHDHRLKTHAGWALVEGTGRRPFVPPDHPRHPENAGQNRGAA